MFQMFNNNNKKLEGLCVGEKYMEGNGGGGGEGWRDGVRASVSVETLPLRDPIFLIGSNYPLFSVAAFQWSHLF